MSRIKKHAGLIMVAGFLMLMFPGSGVVAQETGDVAATAEEAVAAEAETQDDADSAARTTIEEVVVTATRRSESVQDVPISVAAITGSEIRAMNKQSLEDLSSAVPNFVFAPSLTAGDTNISIRGVYSYANPANVGMDQSVSVYLDGVFLGKQYSANQEMGDIERVEVLRGPQGTLYGKNTIGGAVSIITKKPGNEFEGDVKVEAGNYDLLRARASVNIPIVDDKLAMRLYVGGQTRGGYVTNILPERDEEPTSNDVFSGRFQLRWTPTDKATFNLSVDYFNAEGYTYFFERIEDAPFSDGVKYTTNNDFPNKSDRDNYGAALNFDYAFSNGYTLTSITGFRSDDMAFSADVSADPVDSVNFATQLEIQQFSQELRIASPSWDKADFVAGLYYFTQENDLNDTLFFGQDFLPPLAGTVSTDQSMPIDSFAAFVHANFHLGEKTTLFAGGRYTDEKKHLVVHGNECSNPVACMVFNFPTGVEMVAPEDVEMSEPSWLLGLRYEFNDNFMGYASISTGVKSGAYNGTRNPEFTAETTNLTTDPEYVTNYEVGAKTTWLDGSLIANAALFYMDYEDLQVITWCETCGVGNEQVLSNAAEVTTKGFELELTALPGANWMLSAGVGYADATFDSFENVVDKVTGEVVDASGDRVPNSPEWTVNASIQYQIPVSNGASFPIRLDYSYLGERYSLEGVPNHEYFALPAMGQLNLRAGYRSDTKNWGAWGVSLWGRNLTDEQPLVHAGYSKISPWFPGRVGQYAQPTTYGASLEFHF